MSTSVQPDPIRKLGHDIRDFLQQVMATCHLVLAQSEEDLTKVHVRALLERSRSFKTAFNTQIGELTPMKTPSLNILIVEDDSVTKEFLGHTLKTYGHRVVAMAETGHEMVKCVQNNKDIDLIVFDIHLPGCDGISAIHQIHNMGRMIPAVAVTGDKDVELVDRAMGQGNLLGYLIKPVEPVQLVSAIRVAYSSYLEFESIREEKDTLEATIELNKLLKKAKSRLQRQWRWSEDTAHRKLQQFAMDTRQPIDVVAQGVLDGRISIL